MRKKLKTIPKFKNENEERDFWATADSSEYFDFNKAEEVSFPNLKPTSRAISIRIPEYLLDRVKEKANLPIMLSIIIPAYNEEKYLRRLLRLIKNQSYQPKEIIVADNRSTDKTVSIAKKFGCRVIKGGTPAQGRTAGGKAATGSILLFLDADVIFKGKNFLKRIINNYKNNRNSIATVWFVSQERNFISEFVCWTANLNKKINLIIAKKWRVVIGDYGLFIICSRSIFNTVGFFPILATNAITMEDALFFREAVKKGAQYKVFPEKIYISGRRLKNKNLFRLLTWGTLCLLIIIASFLKLRVNKDILRWYEEIRKGR